MDKENYILVDFPVDDPLAEYFNYKGMEFDFLPGEAGAPAVDVIADRISGKDKVSLILSPLSTLKKLYKEKSIYNDFNEISKKLTIILYDEMDLLLDLYKIADREPDFSSWINGIGPDVFTDGIAGTFFHERYPKCQFMEMSRHPVISRGAYPELSTLKRHLPVKDFLCLTCQSPEQPYRKLFYDSFEKKGLLDSTIYNFQPRGTNTHNDLAVDYQQIIIKDRWLDALPPVSFYNQTNLEVVVETLPMKPNKDDTFDISEKIIKPITMEHPFMVLSNFNFLKNLRDLGFMTFGDHLDESYDTEEDVIRRMDIITDNMRILKGESLKLYEDTEKIRTHNLSNLQNLLGKSKTKLWREMDIFWRTR